MEPSPLTPAELRNLAAAAEELADRIQEAHQRLLDQVVGHRLDATAWSVRVQVVRPLQLAASDLARVLARPAKACAAPAGCCPEHGSTLTGRDGMSWCTMPGCGRTWDYDRRRLPCLEPGVVEVDPDPTDPNLRHWACSGHARQNAPH